MRYLLDATGKRRLGRLVAGAAPLYAFDFDGTLARIVHERHAAAMTEPVRAALGKLSGKAVTAIVSGRSLDDLRGRVNGVVPHLIGNHGMEGLHTSHQVMHRAKECSRGWIKQMERFHPALRRRAVSIEDKTYSLSMHYRDSGSPLQAKELVLSVTAQLTPLPRLVPGKAVINVVPPGTPHKGTAILELMRQLECEAALYVGDDDTDEDVFSLPDERIVTVRIGKKTASAARYYLNTQPEIVQLLAFLLRSYESRHT
ncbi:MAG: trehalose-phosphatase [Nitrospiraceae bacterium]